MAEDVRPGWLTPEPALLSGLPLLSLSGGEREWFQAFGLPPDSTGRDEDSPVSNIDPSRNVLLNSTVCLKNKVTLPVSIFTKWKSHAFLAVIFTFYFPNVWKGCVPSRILFSTCLSCPCGFYWHDLFLPPSPICLKLGQFCHPLKFSSKNLIALAKQQRGYLFIYFSS